MAIQAIITALHGATIRTEILAVGAHPRTARILGFIALLIGLALAPANPYAWFRLAHLDLALDGATPAAAKAVSLGLATGPYESTLLWSKLATGLRVWAYLDSADHTTLKTLIPKARQQNRQRMVRLAATTRHLKLLFTE